VNSYNISFQDARALLERAFWIAAPLFPASARSADADFRRGLCLRFRDRDNWRINVMASADDDAA
jgi:hypothetical protein